MTLERIIVVTVTTIVLLAIAAKKSNIPARVDALERQVGHLAHRAREGVK